MAAINVTNILIVVGWSILLGVVVTIAALWCFAESLPWVDEHIDASFFGSLFLLTALFAYGLSKLLPAR